MISYLKAKYHGGLSGKAILEAQGVGYGVWLPDQLKSRLKMGKEVELYIYTHVREDVLDLYGFSQKDELELFQLLLNVSGVGPKSALIIIDRGVVAVRQAIVSTDVSFFTSIPRIGKKNAQKIILELKGKLGSLAELDLENIGGQTQEVIEALQAVGFSKSEALEAVRNLPGDVETIEDKIRYALKQMRVKAKGKNG